MKDLINYWLWITVIVWGFSKLNLRESAVWPVIVYKQVMKELRK